jgi:predicted HTH transcriptional regulator
MTYNELKDKLLNGERVSLECKKARNEVPKSLWETYSAFANSLGGTILLGIEEDLKEKDSNLRFKIMGVENAKKIISDFWNTVNCDKVSVNLLRDEDVSILEIDGKEVVCIHIPQADFTLRPVYLNGNPLKGTFRRNHEGDYHCTDSEVKAMLRDANENGNDSTMAEYYGMEEVDADSLRQYRTEFRILNDGHIWNSYDDKKFLTNLGGYIVDKKTEKEGLSVAGLLMFGNGLAIRNYFANFRMDYVDMSHLVGDERYHDRLTYDGLWENNIYQFFHRVVPKLTMDLPRPFRMEGIKRIDDTPQHKAIREAFTNSIIHCDVFLSGGVLRIDKYDDRFCFRNPGILKLPIEQVYEGGTSKARNPKIQNMLRMIGYGENLGSGFPKILSAWKQAGWKEPLLENRLDLDEVRLTLFVPFEVSEEGGQTTDDNVLRNVRDDVLRNVLRNVLNKFPIETINALTERQVSIIVKLSEKPDISSRELGVIFSTTDRTIRRDLNQLKSLGIIRHNGSTKKGLWEIVI